MERNISQKKKRGSGIIKISELFKKYTDVLKAPQKTVVKNFIEVIQDLFDITIRPDQCSYSVASQTLSLSVSGTLKTEIMLQKKNIIEQMKQRLGEKNTVREIL